VIHIGVILTIYLNLNHRTLVICVNIKIIRNFHIVILDFVLIINKNK